MMRNRNIVNSVWNMMDIFIYPCLFFVTTPFFLQRLGQAQFGIWMLITSIMLTMQILNFGIGNAVLKNVSYYLGKCDPVASNAVINNAISITLLLFIPCILLSVAGYYLVMHFDLLHIDAAYKTLCAQCILLAGCLVGLKFFDLIFINYYKALERFKMAALLGSGNRLLALTLNFTLLHFIRLDIFQVLLVMVAVNFLFVLIGWTLLKRPYSACPFHFQIKMPAHEARFTMLLWLQSLCMILTFQSDRYLVVNYYGLVTLGYYSLIATLFNHLHMGLNAILPWLAPKFTKLHVQNIDSQLIYIAASNLVSSSALVLLMAFSISYPYLFKWLFDAQMLQQVHEFTKCFIAFEAFFALSIVPAYYLNAVGHERTYFQFILLFSLAALVAMFVFIRILHTPLSVIYGLFIACVGGMAALLMLMQKIQTGHYRAAASIMLLFPSLLTALFVFSNELFLKLIFGLGALAAIYFTNLRGRRQQFLRLIRL